MSHQAFYFLVSLFLPSEGFSVYIVYRWSHKATVIDQPDCFFEYLRLYFLTELTVSVIFEIMTSSCISTLGLGKASYWFSHFCMNKFWVLFYMGIELVLMHIFIEARLFFVFFKGIPKAFIIERNWCHEWPQYNRRTLCEYQLYLLW